jgi:predicted TIM-barrel fold metal-dependent hydrolase
MVNPISAAGTLQPPALFRIDCQSHLLVPEVVAMMEKRNTPPYVYHRDGKSFFVTGKWNRPLLPGLLDVEGKLASMDANGIRLTTLSTNDPGPENFGAEGVKVARLINDYIGGLARQFPDRFVGLAMLPLHDMEAALKQLDRCVNHLGMGGILLYSNLAGKTPDLPEFRPLFARAAEMGIPILLHPTTPLTYEFVNAYEGTGGIGLMFDTTIALTRIIQAGILEDYPNFKLVCPHAGGALPYLIGRLDHQARVLNRGSENLKKPPSEYLKQVYLDVVSPLPLAIKFAYDFAGPDKVLYASDHPWVDPELIIDCVGSLNLNATDLQKLYVDNARKLFSLD